MNILYVCPEFFYPPKTGGKLAMYQKFNILSYSNNNIFVFCVEKEIVSKDDFNYISSKCQKLQICYRKKDLSTIFRTIKYPYAVASRSSKRISNQFEKFICENDISLIIYELPQMAILGKKNKINKIIEFHNVEFSTLLSISKTYKNPVKRFIYKIESKKLYLYEKNIYKHNYYGFSFISNKDIYDYKNIFDLRKVSNIGIFPPLFPNNFLVSNNKFNYNKLVFIANFKYSPNVEGALWLINKVMPSIVKKIPQVQLFLVGKNPPDSISCHSSRNIIITGEVESLSEYYEMANVILIPIFSGGGIKMKLIEASSYGKLILSTPFGIYGSFYDEKSIVIAKSTDDYIEKIIDILNNYEKYKPVLKKCRDIFEKYYEKSKLNEEKYLNFVEGSTNVNT